MGARIQSGSGGDGRRGAGARSAPFEQEQERRRGKGNGMATGLAQTGLDRLNGDETRRRGDAWRHGRCAPPIGPNTETPV